MKVPAALCRLNLLGIARADGDNAIRSRDATLHRHRSDIMLKDCVSAACAAMHIGIRPDADTHKLVVPVVSEPSALGFARTATLTWLWRENEQRLQMCR